MTIDANASAAGVYWYGFSIGEERRISSVQFKFTQTPTNGKTVVYDIEEATLGFNVEKVN